MVQYLDRAKPLYERRTAIISGSAPPTAEEIAAGEAESAKDDEEYEPLPTDSTATAPIDAFWLTVLRNHLGISELVTDRDAEALKHLTDVQVSYLSGEDQLGFKLSFFFSPNEYFEDAVLEKTYLYRPEIDWSGDYTYDRALGTQIHWKEEKDLTKEVEVKKQRNKSMFYSICHFDILNVCDYLATNRTRLIRKLRSVDSFFNFFSPPVQPAPEAIESGEVDDDELGDLEDRLALDYQVCLLYMSIMYHNINIGIPSSFSDWRGLQGQSTSFSISLSFQFLDSFLKKCRLSHMRSTTSQARPLNGTVMTMKMTATRTTQMTISTMA